LEDPRDPMQPFTVVSSNLTEASSAWSAAHWRQPAEDDGGQVLTPEPIDYRTAPTTEQWPPLDRPYPPPPNYGQPPVDPVDAPTGFPAPGSTSWFTPPPPPQPPPPAPTSVGIGAVAQALTPGVIICLVIGGLISLLAPITFLLAFALSSRMRVGLTWTRGLLGAGLCFMGIAAFIAIVQGDEWWLVMSLWAQLLSWVVLVVGGILVYRELRRGTPPVRNPQA
jgi:hypothetical protein